MAQFIWTHHARQRLKDRKIPQRLIDQTLFHPDHTETKNGTTELSKRIEDRTYFVLIKKNDNGEKIIISCWVNPPYPGTRDAKKRTRYLEKQKASPLRKLWLTILDQLGL